MLQKKINKRNYISLWKPIFVEVESIDFYLGTKLSSAFHIKKEKFDICYKTWIEYLQGGDFFSTKAQNFLELVEDIMCDQATLNTNGDIKDLPVGSGGDIWPLDLLELISSHIEDASQVILQDDGRIYHKILFVKGQCIYYSEDLNESGYSKL